PLSVLEEEKKVLQVPICAIGGINEENIGEIAKSGIEMYSVISAIYKEDKIEKNIEMLQRKINQKVAQ
ncbi:MAG: thiamine phosphate synthase, partial [Sulfurospirillaceae bacterium]|nr:thiamine phosphate synthase [Sulfurospirillaceae bacterium]